MALNSHVFTYKDTLTAQFSARKSGFLRLTDVQLVWLSRFWGSGKPRLETILYNDYQQPYKDNFYSRNTLHMYLANNSTILQQKSHLETQQESHRFGINIISLYYDEHSNCCKL